MLFLDGGARRLKALIENLPSESATYRNGDPWASGEHLLANVADLIAIAFQVKSKAGDLFQTPRPGAPDEAAPIPEAVKNMRELMMGK